MDQERDKRIKKEIRRLKRILGKDSPRVVACEHLIRNAAFMSVSLEDLQAEINETGWTETYQNGANQSGVKRSAASDCYTSTYRNYLATMKQLAEIAPEGTEIDALTAFNA